MIHLQPCCCVQETVLFYIKNKFKKDFKIFKCISVSSSYSVSLLNYKDKARFITNLKSLLFVDTVHVRLCLLLSHTSQQ